jgi:energy-coupling factor transporter ATP-binding protein EcfA2
MNNYNFSTLNDKEFEQISKDLLNAKFKLELQDFRIGKDKGTDLRFSTSENDNSIVVQVKHYIGSEFAQLKHTLLSKELLKVQNLKPNRYIIVTSLSLSATQKDILKKGLSPFVLTSNDIIGQEDLNGYLTEFKEIEKIYFKLWFSSINVFNAIISNAIEGRTKYLLEKIKNKIPFYVVTQKLDDANKILQKEKLLLITGQPGIGKTTLAEIMLFERAKNGYKIYKVENIKEAEDVISPNEDEKQLFYFDDFLGANYFEIINSHKTETQLTSFVERVKSTPNKYLILTTRTIILNHAIEKYEKISHSKLGNQQFEIKLQDYSTYEKALILYNHIYFKEVREDLYDCILTEKFYKKIIQHKNYTPRIIEFITDSSRIEKLNSETYIQFILNNLNNPKEIWRYSYNNQIGYLDRCLLLTLFTFESHSFESTLIKAFEERLIYEKEVHNQIINANQFHESIKILLNGFVTSTLYNRDSYVREFIFINPSLTDFLIGHISDSFPERKSIIASVKYIEQLDRFSPEKQLIPLEKELQLIIRDRINDSKIQIQESKRQNLTENIKYATFMEALCKFCNQVDIDSLLIYYFSKILFAENWVGISFKIEYVLIHLENSPQTFNFVKLNFISIAEKFMDSIYDLDSANQIPLLFDKYEQEYDEYIETTEGFQNLSNVIVSVLQSSEDDLINERKDSVEDIDDARTIYDELETIEDELMKNLLPNISIFPNFRNEMDNDFWEEKIEENIKNSQMNSRMNEYYEKDYIKEQRAEIYNEEQSIDDLFIKKV